MPYTVGVHSLSGTSESAWAPTSSMPSCGTTTTARDRNSVRLMISSPSSPVTRRWTSPHSRRSTLAPRQVGAFALAAVLFLTSLLTARLIVANPLSLSALNNASPTPTQAVSVDQPTATPVPAAVSTSTPPPQTPPVQQRGTGLLEQSNTTASPLPEGCLI